MNATTLFIEFSAALLSVAFVSFALLRGWQGWLDLKRENLAGDPGPPPSPASLIELADLKERVRKLEAIANGVDFEGR